ncbi:hypothetical protein K2P47_02040 [Patescibacteria group bacterium]|nr:hypothetical protein [Patescibacteria group bacterium]
MDTAYVLSLLQELIYLFCVFGFFIVWAIVRGRQSLINIIFGLYLALLISLEFPYYDTFLPNNASEHSLAVGKMVLFAIFTTIATILVARVMPDAYREKKFESFFKKILLALAGTILIMAYSFHVLPVTEFVTPGTPIASLFSPKEWFFWWLLLPMVFLYLN